MSIILEYLKKNIITRDSLIINAFSSEPSWEIKVNELKTYHQYFIHERDVKIYQELYIIDSHARLLKYFIKNSDFFKSNKDNTKQVKTPIPLTKKTIATLSKAIEKSLPTLTKEKQNIYMEGKKYFIELLSFYSDDVCELLSNYLSLHGALDNNGIFKSNYYHVNRKNKEVFEKKFKNFIERIEENSDVLLYFINEILIDDILDNLFTITLKEKFQNQETIETDMLSEKRQIEFLKSDESMPLKVINAKNTKIVFWVDAKNSDRYPVVSSNLSPKHPFTLGEIVIIGELIGLNSDDFHGKLNYQMFYRRMRAYYLVLQEKLLENKSDYFKEIKKTLNLLTEEINTIDMVVDQSEIVRNKNTSITVVAIKGDIKYFLEQFSMAVKNDFNDFIKAEESKKVVSVFIKHSNNFSYPCIQFFIEKSYDKYKHLIPHTKEEEHRKVIQRIIKKQIYDLFLELTKIYIVASNQYSKENKEKIAQLKESNKSLEEKNSKCKEGEDKSILAKEENSKRDDTPTPSVPIIKTEENKEDPSKSIMEYFDESLEIIDDTTMAQNAETDGYNNSTNEQESEQENEEEVFSELDEIEALEEE